MTLASAPKVDVGEFIEWLQTDEADAGDVAAEQLKVDRIGEGGIVATPRPLCFIQIWGIPMINKKWQSRMTISPSSGGVVRPGNTRAGPAGGGDGHR